MKWNVPTQNQILICESQKVLQLEYKIPSYTQSAIKKSY